jgi:hypothetical protein
MDISLLPSFLVHDVLLQDIGLFTEMHICITSGAVAIKIAIPDPLTHDESF